jgi:hypothetical protein
VRRRYPSFSLGCGAPVGSPVETCGQSREIHPSGSRRRLPASIARPREVRPFYGRSVDPTRTVGTNRRVGLRRRISGMAAPPHRFGSWCSSGICRRSTLPRWTGAPCKSL